MAIEVTDKNFDEVVIKSNKPVIVDFWATWCGPCRMIAPIMDEIGEEYKDKAVVTKLDVDKNPRTTFKYGIRNIPAVFFFKNGQIADKQIGTTSKSKFIAKLEALLK